jgi:hypothetical protein
MEIIHIVFISHQLIVLIAGIKINAIIILELVRVNGLMLRGNISIHNLHGAGGKIN